MLRFPGVVGRGERGGSKATSQVGYTKSKRELQFHSLGVVPGLQDVEVRVLI